MFEFNVTFQQRRLYRGQIYKRHAGTAGDQTSDVGMHGKS